MTEQKETGTITQFFENPVDVLKSPKFGIFSASAQFIALIVFAIVGAGIQFRFETFRDLLNLDYWVTVVVMLGEQLYAFNIGYDLGRTLMMSSNKELIKAEEQIEGIVEGVAIYDDNDNFKEWKLEPMKKDTTYIDKACEVLTTEDKLHLITTNTKELIKMLESKVAEYKSYKHTTWIFAKKLVINRKNKKRFHKKATAITFCESQITYGKNLIDDKDSMLAIPDTNVAGYHRIEYSNVISAQSDNANIRVSKYHQRSEKAAKAKMAGSRALKKLALATIGGSFLFGMAADGKIGTIVYMVGIMLWQVFSGFKFGGNNVINIILYNTVNRLKALQDIRRILPDIKKQEVKEVIETKEVIAETEEITPPNLEVVTT